MNEFTINSSLRTRFDNILIINYNFNQPGAKYLLTIISAIRNLSKY